MYRIVQFTVCRSFSLQMPQRRQNLHDYPTAILVLEYICTDNRFVAITSRLPCMVSCIHVVFHGISGWQASLKPIYQVVHVKFDALMSVTSKWRSSRMTDRPVPTFTSLLPPSSGKKGPRLFCLQTTVGFPKALQFSTHTQCQFQHGRMFTIVVVRRHILNTGVCHQRAPNFPLNIPALLCKSSFQQCSTAIYHRVTNVGQAAVGSTVLQDSVRLCHRRI